MLNQEDENITTVMNEKIRLLAEQLSGILGMGSPVSIREKSMDEYEKGFSGAELFRVECSFADGRTADFICKKADLRERMVMLRLTAQGHSHTPAAYTDDRVSPESAWMIEQDLGKRVAAPRNDLDWIRNAALAFADIHGDNMGRGGEMPWLPRADAGYWNEIVTKISLSHFEKAIREDAGFAGQFGAVLPDLRAAAEKFARDMTALCGEPESMTLTHGDVQTMDGSHVYNVNSRPYIIDFGFSRYAPFYIDLVDYFSPDEALIYRQALEDRGIRVSKSDFDERFRAAYGYPGFIYMFPGIMQWKRGSDTRLKSCISRILNDSR